MFLTFLCFNIFGGCQLARDVNKTRFGRLGYESINQFQMRKGMRQIKTEEAVDDGYMQVAIAMIVDRNRCVYFIFIFLCLPPTPLSSLLW